MPKVINVPSVTSTGATDVFHNSHRRAGHRMTRVGAVAIPQQHGGGTFDVWYCQDDNALFIDKD